MKKSTLGFMLFVLSACTAPAKAIPLGTLTCDSISFEIVEIVVPGKLFQMERRFQSYLVKSDGKAHPLQADFDNYRKFLPESFKRKIVGELPENKRTKVFNVYLKNLPQNLHVPTEKCLVDKQVEFRSAIHSRSQPIRSFLDRNKTAFIFWEDEKEALEFEFKAETGETLSITTNGNIYYRNPKNKTFFVVTHLKLKDGGISPVSIDLKARTIGENEIDPQEKNPKKYLFRDKHINEFFKTSNPKTSKSIPLPDPPENVKTR